MTWTLLIWLAQAMFDLFVWVLLVALVVTGGYRGRHDRQAAQPAQDGQTSRLE